MRIPKDLETREKILEWAARYPPDESRALSEKILANEGNLISHLKGSDHFGEYITRDDLLKIVSWKLQSRRREWGNSEEEVERISREAFSAKSDADRIKKLSELSGVGWSVASAILHLAHTDRYPIFDQYATLAVDAPYLYEDKPWEGYAALLREEARKHDISMRTLDRALFTYGYHKSKNKSP